MTPHADSHAHTVLLRAQFRASLFPRVDALSGVWIDRGTTIVILPARTIRVSLIFNVCKIHIAMQGPSTHGGNGNDQETVFAPVLKPRSQPFILLIDPVQGFVLPAAPSDGNHLKRTSSIGTGRPPAVKVDARAYLRTTSMPVTRNSGTPFNSSTIHAPYANRLCTQHFFHCIYYLQ